MKTAPGSLGRLGFAADRDVRVFAPDGRAGLARNHGGVGKSWYPKSSKSWMTMPFYD